MGYLGYSNSNFRLVHIFLTYIIEALPHGSQTRHTHGTYAHTRHIRTHTRHIRTHTSHTRRLTVEVDVETPRLNIP